MTERVLTTRELNRALLARQLLLERSRMPLVRAVERVGGLQTQYAPSAYIGLWTRLERFDLDQLTRALERKRVIQGTLMRSTIHVVSARDYWPFSDGLGPSREAWWRRSHGKNAIGDIDAVRERLRAELAGRVWQRKELDEVLRTHGSTLLARGLAGAHPRAPVRDVERRRADLFQLAEEWMGRREAGEEAGLAQSAPPLPRRLRAGHGERGGELGRCAGDENEGSVRAPQAAALSQRGGQGAARPPAVTAARCRHPGTGSLPSDVGRHAPRARAPDADPSPSTIASASSTPRARSRSPPSWSTAPFPERGAGSAPARRRRSWWSRSSGYRAVPFGRCATRPRGSSGSSSLTRPRTRLACETDRMRT